MISLEGILGNNPGMTSDILMFIKTWTLSPGHVIERLYYETKFLLQF